MERGKSMMRTVTVRMAAMTISVMMVNKIIQSNQYGYANTLGILLLVLGILVMLFCNKLFRMDSVD